MRRPNGVRDTIRGAILNALKLRICLSTDGLSEWSGKLLLLPENQWCTDQFKAKIYRQAVAMEKSSRLIISEKVWNGKGYERIWRRR